MPSRKKRQRALAADGGGGQGRRVVAAKALADREFLRASGCGPAERPTDADGFIAVRSDSESEDASAGEEAVAATGEQVEAGEGGPAACGRGADGGGGESPFALDLRCSDPLLHVEPHGPTSVLASAAAGALPTAWAFGRGAWSVAGMERGFWRLKIVSLDPEIRPSVMAGWLAQPLGASCLPGPPGPPTGEAKEPAPDPALVLAADTGHQLFTSNTSEALRCTALLPPTADTGVDGALTVGDVLEVGAEPRGQRAWFAVRGRGQPVDAVRLPTGRRAIDGPQPPRGGVPCYPIVAVRGSARVEVLQRPGGSQPAPPEPELTLLVGPPGAGKSAWAMQMAHQRAWDRTAVHVLGAEWLQHRASFAAAAMQDAGVGRPVPSSSSASAPSKEAGQLPERPKVPAGALVAAPLALRVLLGLDPSLADSDYWEKGQGWDLRGIEADLRIARSRLCLDGAKGAEKDDIRALAARVLPGRCTLQSARDALAELLPGLLRSAAERGAVAVADDCHLQEPRRKCLEQALEEALGVAARRCACWLVLLPASVQEFRRRRSSQMPWLRAADERRGTTLPGSLSGLRVGFAPGAAARADALAVFEAWRTGETAESGVAEVQADRATPDARGKEGGFQAVFGGEDILLLSTEGTRRL
mmetsp:Transcript_3671/g.11797  ORF Transcript_3671/g.11797 Transcript_3671/m.11797 type:complete len:645 (+) Transcript_3671:104-2038(+)